MCCLATVVVAKVCWLIPSFITSLMLTRAFFSLTTCIFAVETTSEIVNILVDLWEVQGIEFLIMLMSRKLMTIDK